VIDCVIPAGLNYCHIFIDQFLLLLEFPLDDTVQRGRSTGYDESFAKESVYNFQRERELKILTDPAIQQAIETHGIQLINFADL